MSWTPVECSCQFDVMHFINVPGSPTDLQCGSLEMRQGLTATDVL